MYFSTLSRAARTTARASARVARRNLSGSSRQTLPKAAGKSKAAAVAGASAVAGGLLIYDQSRRNELAAAHCASNSVYGLLQDLNDRMSAIESALGVGLSMFRSELDRIADVKKSNPGNRAMKYFDEGYFAGLGLPKQKTFLNIVRTGFENPDSGLGCYAMTPADYDEFNEFFDPVIRDYHGASKGAVHVTDWDASAVGDNGVLDVTKLGLPELSMRVRVGRNLASFNLPGSMDRDERIRFEKTMLKAFQKLIADPEYGGSIYSLSPDHGDGPNPNLISDAKYNELVKAHVMFKDMDADPYLKSAGISSDWPYGRGCWQSADKQCIIWFGEEDQLRIMCMKKGSRLDEVFNRLKKMLDTVESIEGIDFARSDKYGYITSCPSNLGTGMRASVHIKVPNLTSDGTDKKAKEICKPLGLSVRGTGGEHTPIGADGTIDVSPRARLFIKERDIIAKLYQGISDLMDAEKAAK